VTFQLAQIVAQLVQTIRWFGETEGGADGLVDFLRGPAAEALAVAPIPSCSGMGMLYFLCVFQRGPARITSCCMYPTRDCMCLRHLAQVGMQL
jgi:hypothetical protein